MKVHIMGHQVKNVFVIILFLLASYYITAAPVFFNFPEPQNELKEPPIMEHKPFIEVRNSTYHGYGPREEARAMCSVRTQEVNATANATITRRLYGVVTSRELRSSVQRIELIIHGQMQQLWQSLDALRDHLTEGRNSYPDRRTIAFRYQPDVG